MFNKLENNHSLEILEGKETVYSDTGKWLHPLLDCEDFVSTYENKKALILHDKIQGQAAAALSINLGFSKVYVDLISSKALELYERFPEIEVEYLEEIESIWCATESLITPDMKIFDIVTFLKHRAGK